MTETRGRKIRAWYPDLLIFLASLLVYTFYFHPILLNLNSLLSGVTLDTFKNYYTYLYHVRNDPHWLTFEGMNYPFGEHLVYTDCQPLLTWLLRPLPFAHGYLIGILHFLIFFSHIITPNILFRVLKRAGVTGITGAALALGIGLLSPQFLKIQAGHHTLSYACIIPLTILLLQRLWQQGGSRNAWLLFLFNCLLFLIHPYFGFSVSIFSFFSICFYGLFNGRLVKIRSCILQAFCCAILPLLLFKLFMLLTDHKTDRPEEPIGVNFMVENLHSLLSPDFGPLKAPTEKFFHNKPPHFEGHTYLGLAVILSALSLLLALLLRRRKPALEKGLLSVLLSAFILLLLAFGVHYDILSALKLSSNTFNQFRATCRFAWFFYYALALFVGVTCLHTFSFRKQLVNLIAVIFFCVSLWEANYLFRYNEEVYWRYTNIFHEKFLDLQQKKILAEIRAIKGQALVPLPIFHGGNELYDRLGFNNSMTPAMLYSYHSGLPVISASLSRSSASETEALIETLNSYKNKRTVDKYFTPEPFVLLKTLDPLLPDEERLLSKSMVRSQFDSLTVLAIAATEIREPVIDEDKIAISSERFSDTDLVYIKKAEQKPFIPTTLDEFGIITNLDSGMIRGGSYIVSLHFYPLLETGKKKTYKNLAADLIAATGNGSEWIRQMPLRVLSGFYGEFAVFEYELFLPPGKDYQFFIKGWEKQRYFISDFMLRPKGRSVINHQQDQVYSINNFPLR